MPTLILCIFRSRVIRGLFLFILVLSLWLTAIKIGRTKRHAYLLEVPSAEDGSGVSMTKSWMETGDPFLDLPRCNFRPFLLILVASAPENFQRRSAIRRAWGRASLRRLAGNLSSVTFFLVGRSSGSGFLNILVENERISRGDLVVGDYLDSYRNLTFKVIHGIGWARDYCPSSYLLKTDDDCYVNVALILGFLWQNNRVYRGLYVGRRRTRAKVVRDPTSKWYVSEEQFPPAVYPDYVSGIGYILSSDVVSLLVEGAENWVPFPNEDAFVGAVLNGRGVKPIHSSRFSLSNGPWRVCNFLYLFVVHRISAEYQRKMQAFSDMALVECSVTRSVDQWN